MPYIMCKAKYLPHRPHLLFSEFIPVGLFPFLSFSLYPVVTVHIQHLPNLSDGLPMMMPQL